MSKPATEIDSFHCHRWAYVLSQLRVRIFNRTDSGDPASLVFKKLDDKIPPLNQILLYWLTMQRKLRLESSLIAGQLDLLNLLSEFWNSESMRVFSEAFFRDSVLLARQNNLPQLDFDYALLKRDWHNIYSDLNAHNSITNTKSLVDHWIKEAMVARFGFHREIVLSAMLTMAAIERSGREAVEKAVEISKSRFAQDFNGFVNEALEFSGITAAGRYAQAVEWMRADHIISFDIRRENCNIITQIIFQNCPIFGTYDYIEKAYCSGRRLTEFFCRMCEEHATLTTAGFVPNKYNPVFSLKSCLGRGDKKCLFAIITTPTGAESIIRQAGVT